MDNLAVGHMTGVKAKQRSNGISFYWKHCDYISVFNPINMFWLHVHFLFFPPNSFNRKLTKAVSSSGSRTIHRCKFCKRSLCFLVCTPNLQGEDVTHFPPKNHCPAVDPLRIPSKSGNWDFEHLSSHTPGLGRHALGLCAFCVWQKKLCGCIIHIRFLLWKSWLQLQRVTFLKIGPKLARNWPENDPLLHHFVFSPAWADVKTTTEINQWGRKEKPGGKTCVLPGGPEPHISISAPLIIIISVLEKKFSD